MSRLIGKINIFSKILIFTFINVLLFMPKCFAEEHKEIKVGILLGFTGAVETLTPPMAESAELAFNEIAKNEDAVKDIGFKLLRADTACNNINFAKNSAPQRPIEGQLWYDITPGINQLKVYDGTNWVSSGGLKKGGNQPGSAESTAGDLWVDTGNQQLYLFTGSGWILVGPEFSTGLSSGTKPESIAGTDDVTHSIVKIQVAGKVIAIIASESFTPKSNIAGFSTLQPGVNLSLTDVEGDGIPKMYGTAEKADALVVGNQTIAANNFLRSDTTSSSDFGLKIKNNAGVEVGLSGTLKLSVEGQAGVLSHQTAGSNIDFKVNDSGVSRTVMRIDATQKVGINTTAPTEALEVLGNLKTTGLDSSNGKVIVDNSTDSTSVGTGAITTIGGVGISKSLTVGENVNVGGNLSVDAIMPNDNLTHDIGSTNKKFLNVYGNQFYGSFNGNVSGSLNGVATQANQLTSATTFQMTGDVSATGFTFDGTGDLVKSFTTSIPMIYSCVGGCRGFVFNDFKSASPLKAVLILIDGTTSPIIIPSDSKYAAHLPSLPNCNNCVLLAALWTLRSQTKQCFTPF